MDDTLRCFEVRLRRSGFKIIYDEPESLIPTARVDRDAIVQALANLMDNALKYSGDSRERLLETVWGYGRGSLTRTVDMHIAKLRKKIEKDPSEPAFIITVHRMGYKFTG